MLETFEKYKNEIVEEIKKLNEKMEVFTDENLSVIRLNSDEENSEASSDEESTSIDEYISGLATSEQSSETNQLLSTIVEQQETIIEQQALIKNALHEGSWIISITIIIALGFKYFMEQFSKW